MHTSRRVFQLLLACSLASVVAGPGFAEEPEKPFEPRSGQPGKDVVWVPTPPALIETMLDMAEVTPGDVVMDLGSGDGRMVIAAAKRGARALGVEYEEKMVALSRFNAEKEGVADKAQFVQGDMFEADLSEATVLALFLLTENLDRLAPKFLAMKPGSRIVINGYHVSAWEPDERRRTQGECGTWCTAYLYFVPARVEGTWRLADGKLELEQRFQEVRGTLSSGGNSKPIEGRLRGDRITFTVDGAEYVGRVDGNEMAGETIGSSAAWRAVRQ